MTTHIANHFSRLIVFSSMVFCWVAGLSGCASYYSHYGSFQSYNSNGEPRLFAVSWQTAESALFDASATPIKLTTQCSDRELIFKDGEFDPFPCQGSGIVACGSPEFDLDRDGRPVAANSHVCASITDERGAKRIVDLQGKIIITISCWPESTGFDLAGEKKNRDYLRASVVPYTLFTKKVPMYSLESHPPVLSDRICKSKKK